jgi:hypothetical protein
VQSLTLRRVLARTGLSLTGTRAPGKHQRSGGDRDRTDDPLLAKQVLSQLSYTPVRNSQRHRPEQQNPAIPHLRHLRF